MIKVSILYPYRENGRFDADYYCTRHMPLAARLLGDALRGWSVDIGINGGRPSAPPPYAAVGNLLFDTLEVFQAAFKPHGRTLMEDVPNFTDGGAGAVQVSEIKAQG